ncbi:uncharacterized protein LOC122994024 [Scomber scombrus]|uniref:Uncharacterized protein LOC122994024 n=1 Tax=Scomber scombrus TaxID=13677 RepID=A0AAV1QJ22_SCOSC
MDVSHAWFLLRVQCCDNCEGGEQSEVTTSGSSLRVYLLNDSIICNHSNQVSWTRDRKENRPLCSFTADTNEGRRIAIGIVIPVFLLCICCLYRRITNQQKRKNCENPIYESIQDINLNQTPNPNATEDASGLSPTSTYALLGHSTAPVQSTETVNTPKPETIDCML